MKNEVSSGRRGRGVFFVLEKSGTRTEQREGNGAGGGGEMNMYGGRTLRDCCGYIRYFTQSNETVSRGLI